MADVNAANITLYEATPQVDVPNHKHQHGKIYTIVDTVETSTIMSINDTATMARLPVDAILLEFWLAFDDLGTAGDVEVGFWRTQVDGEAVLDIDAMVALLDVNAAAVAFVNYRFDTLDINTVRQPVWDIATVAARPAYDFIDVKVNFLEASTAAGTISVIAKYTF